MSTLTLVARVGSASDVSRTYEVKTDGAILSCPCPGWTRQVHTEWCRAHHDGESCNCKHTAAGTSDRRFRTCRHTREVRRRLDEVGGLARMLPLLRAGVSLDSAREDPAVRHAARAEQTTRDAATVRLRTSTPDRLLTSVHGEGRRPNRGIDTWDIVLVRRDGWTMCFPRNLGLAALRVWPTEWVGMMQWRGGRGVVPFDAALLRRWCEMPQPVARAPRASTRTVPPPTPPPPVPTAPALPSAAPDWLGGRRAIILRE